MSARASTDRPNESVRRNPRSYVRAFWISALLGSSIIGCAGVKHQPVTPQRPSFSSDPNTTAQGTLEVEAGFSDDNLDNRDLPLTLKWGAGERTELFGGFNPYRRTGGPGATDGLGDVVVGGRHRLVNETESRPALAMQAFVKLPTADESSGLGSGQTDFFLAGTAIKSLSRFSVVGFYQLGVVGRPLDQTPLLEHALTGALAYGFSPRVSGFVELTGLWHPEISQEALLVMFGTGYAVSPSLVLDLALQKTLVDGPDGTLWTVGLTWNAGNVFGREQ